MFGGFVDGPRGDVVKAVGGVDEAVVGGESADRAINIVGEVGAIDSDGGNVLLPKAEELFVFGGAKDKIRSTTSAENEIIGEKITIV